MSSAAGLLERELPAVRARAAGTSLTLMALTPSDAGWRSRLLGTPDEGMIDFVVFLVGSVIKNFAESLDGVAFELDPGNKLPLGVLVSMPFADAEAALAQLVTTLHNREYCSYASSGFPRDIIPPGAIKFESCIVIVPEDSDGSAELDALRRGLPANS